MDIAVIGLACRFPGAPDHRAFWRNLEVAPTRHLSASKAGMLSPTEACRTSFSSAAGPHRGPVRRPHTTEGIDHAVQTIVSAARELGWKPAGSAK